MKQKYIIFHESLTNFRKDELLYSHADVIKAVNTGVSLIRTCSFISLDFELFSKYGYNIIIDFYADKEERENLYLHKELGFKCAVELSIGSTYLNGVFDGTENLLELYKSGKLRESINRFQIQDYSYLKLIYDIQENLAFSLKQPSYSIRSSNLFTLDSMNYFMSQRYVEISHPPCDDSIKGFLPHLLKWYRESNEKDHKELHECVIGYYGKIPDYLSDEFKHSSIDEESCIKYFSYIYQLVYVHQLEEIRLNQLIG